MHNDPLGIHYVGYFLVNLVKDSACWLAVVSRVSLPIAPNLVLAGWQMITMNKVCQVT